MAVELDLEAERVLFESAMRDERLSVARALPEYGGKYRFVEERWLGWQAARRAVVPVGPATMFEEVGQVYYERVNGDYEGIVDPDRVNDKEKLYRLVGAIRASASALDLVPSPWVGVQRRLPHKAQMVVVTENFENYALAYQRYTLGETKWFDAHAQSDNDVPLDFVPTHWFEMPTQEQQEKDSDS